MKRTVSCCRFLTLTLVSLIFICLTSELLGLKRTKTPLMLGSIQFPHELAQMPVPRIYYMGKTIPCDVHDKEKKVTFDIPNSKDSTEFYLLVTPSIDFSFKKSNSGKNTLTVDYIKAHERQPYILYKVELLPDGNEETNAESVAFNWQITGTQLDETRRLPDNTIIVLYIPEYIETLVGGSLLELPTLVIKKDVVLRAGSEQALFDQSIELQLASLNSDAIHAPLKHIVKQIGHRTLIAPTA